MLRGKVGRKPWHELVTKAKIEDQFDQICKSIYALSRLLVKVSDCGKVLARCTERCQRMEQNLTAFAEKTVDTINWIEEYDRGFKLHSTPLMVADSFQSFMQRYQCSWIFTSATLTVNSSFNHFQQQLGLTDADTILLDSPYDYATNTRLFLPAIDEYPSHKGLHPDGSGCSATDSGDESRTRIFLLFTSHRALRLAADYLADHGEFTLLIQGEAPRRELLAKFSHTEHAILLGTNSFWEGVDIRGKALSCVVIDKLPFAAPDDPVLNGRLEALRTGGCQSF